MACCGDNNVERKKWTDGATDRINRLRDQFFRNKPELDVFRALVYTRVYQETEAEDLPIRHAKALLAYMTEKPLVIGNDELIIGTEGSKHRSAVVCPEICYKWIEDEMDTMATRPQDPYQISEETKKALREVIFPFWEGKSMEEYFYANMSDELKNIGMGTNIVFSDAKSATGGGEWSVGYHNIVMKKGFKGVREEAEAYLAAYKAQQCPAFGEADPALLYYAGYLLTVDGANHPESFARGAQALNDALAAALGLEDPGPLGDPEGLCRMGTLASPMPLQEFAKHVCRALQANGVRYAGDSGPVRKVAVGGGACGDYEDAAIAAGCDVFVTSDLSYHQFLDAAGKGIRLIDAGHFPTENPVCTVLAEYLRGRFPGLTVTKSASHREVIQYYVEGE